MGRSEGGSVQGEEEITQAVRRKVNTLGGGAGAGGGGGKGSGGFEEQAHEQTEQELATLFFSLPSYFFRLSLIGS